VTHLIDAAALHDLLASPVPPRVLDVRWRLDRPDGRDDHAAGHVPGAVYVDLEHELAEHPPRPGQGRHPLPSREALQAAARRWGLRDGEAVVAYDAVGGLSAARAWWLLRDAGVADVRVLDGGWQAWQEAFAAETGEVRPEPGDVVLDRGRLPVVDLDAVAAGRAGLLLDARAPARFRGEVEPVDPRAGHVPGAVNAPAQESLGPDGRFRPVDELRARATALGAVPGVPVTASCGSGVTATHLVLALAEAGVDAALWPGSWSQWSSRPELPVATGDA